jgi:hypothetical protein
MSCAIRHAWYRLGYAGLTQSCPACATAARMQVPRQALAPAMLSISLIHLGHALALELHPFVPVPTQDITQYTASKACCTSLCRSWRVCVDLPLPLWGGVCGGGGGAHPTPDRAAGAMHVRPGGREEAGLGWQLLEKQPRPCSTEAAASVVFVAAAFVACSCGWLSDANIVVGQRLLTMRSLLLVCARGGGASAAG